MGAKKYEYFMYLQITPQIHINFQNTEITVFFTSCLDADEGTILICKGMKHNKGTCIIAYATSIFFCYGTQDKHAKTILLVQIMWFRACSHLSRRDFYFNGHMISELMFFGKKICNGHIIFLIHRCFFKKNVITNLRRAIAFLKTMEKNHTIQEPETFWTRKRSLNL
ncbi:hypothetical protein ACJX0J_032750, partial [Zea mays]